MKFTNLTPHDVVYMNDDDKILAVFPKSGVQARVSSCNEHHGNDVFKGIR